MPDKTARARKPKQIKASPTREVRRVSTNDTRPLFGLHNLVPRFNITQRDQQGKAALATLLHDMSERTWAQLQLGHRQGTAFEKIAQNGIKVGIPVCITPDVQLLSIRITGVGRLIGFRDDAVFHAVWIDSAHEVYDG